MEASAIAELLSLQASIVYVLLLPGVLFTLVFRHRLSLPGSHDPLIGLLLLGFAASLLCNVLLALLFSAAGLPVSWTLAANALFCAGLLFLWWYNRPRTAVSLRESNRPIWVLVFVFVLIMTQNGSVIESLADSWWHMSLVNQIQQEQTLFLRSDHFTGVQFDRIRLPYEPGWHLQLALIADLSGSPLPLVWYCIGVWIAGLSVLGYYYLARVLLGDRAIAFSAALLFILTLGGINAFFRVSAWPGSAAWVLFYLCLSLVFSLFDGSEYRAGGALSRWIPVGRVVFALREQTTLTCMVMILLALMASLHQAEILWLLALLVFYSFVLSLLDTFRDITLQRDRAWLDYLWFWFLAAWFILAMKGPMPFWKDYALAVGSFFLLPWATAVVARRHRGFLRVVISVILVGSCAVMLILVVDFQHLWTLFRPLDRSELTGANYIPHYLRGWFGDWLILPKWEHQLRGGLLFSGITGIAASVALLVYQRSRATVLLAAGAIFGFLTILSPYLFTFFAAVVNLAATYRFQLLVFHPIILALAIHVMVRKIVSRPT